MNELFQVYMKLETWFENIWFESLYVLDYYPSNIANSFSDEDLRYVKFFSMKLVYFGLIDDGQTQTILLSP